MQAFQVTKCCSLAFIQARSLFFIGQSPCRWWFVKSQHRPPDAVSARPSRILVSCTRTPAGSPKYCNRPGWGLECSAATSLVEWNLVFRGAKIRRTNAQRTDEPTRSRLLGCNCCYGNRRVGSRPISNFLVPVSRQLNEVSFCQKLPMNDLFWWSYDNMLHVSGFFWNTV